jgi:hypothetical protein
MLPTAAAGERDVKRLAPGSARDSVAYLAEQRLLAGLLLQQYIGLHAPQHLMHSCGCCLHCC